MVSPNERTHAHMRHTHTHSWARATYNITVCDTHLITHCVHISLSPVVVPDLLVKREPGHWGVNALPRLGTEAHHLQTRPVYLLSQLVHGNVAGGTHQNLTV